MSRWLAPVGSGLACLTIALGFTLRLAGAQPQSLGNSMMQLGAGLLAFSLLAYWNTAGQYLLKHAAAIYKATRIGGTASVAFAGIALLYQHHTAAYGLFALGWILSSASHELYKRTHP